MIRFTHSLRFRLLMIYILSLMLFATFIMITLPMYYKNTLEEQTTLLKDSTLATLEKNMDFYFEELNRLTVIPYYDENFMDALVKIEYKDYYQLKEKDLHSYYSTIGRTLQSYLLNTREEVVSTLILHNNGHLISCSKKYGPSNVITTYPYENKAWYKKAIRENGQVAFISNHSQDYLYKPIEEENVFSFTRQIIDPTTKEPLCIIMADASTHVFERLFKDLVLDTSYIACIVDQEGNLIYTNDSVLAPSLLSDKQVQNQYILVEKQIDVSQWTMMLFLNQKELLAKNKAIYLYSFVFICIEIIIVIFIIFFMSKTITTPFKRIHQGIKEVEQGNLQVRFYDEGKGELAMLGHSLNSMTHQLDELISKEYKARISQQEAEYAALQSQIHPHFLYNTLNGFIGLNCLGKKDELEEAIISLTQMLRYTLSQEKETTLEKELDVLSHYLHLQKLRFGTRLTYELSSSQSLNQLILPQLLLQPLVENAIIHGIEPLLSQGKIIILCSCINSSIVISIKDNGVGMQNDHTVKQGNSIGLVNVLERLKYIYPTSTLIIESYEGKGTESIITIPIEEAKYEDYHCG